MMKTYAKMKASGVEWICDIPANWGIRALFQISGQVKNKNKDLAEKNLLSLSYGKIKRKDISSSEGLLPESFDGYNIIEANDIVLRLTDLQNDHTSLRVGQAEERGIITSAYTTIRPSALVNPKYLYYVIHTYDLVKGFYGMGAGVRQGLNYNEVKAIKAPFPSIDEQTAIATYLDDQCIQIDTIIEETKESINEYKKWRAAIIFEAVTKGLDKSAKMRDSGVEWIGNIPKQWGVVFLKYTGKFENGLTYSPRDMTNNSGILVLRSSNIQSGKLDYSDCVYVNMVVPKRLLVEKGDIIICSRNGSAELVGKCAIVDDDLTATFGAFMMRYKTNMQSKFAYYVLQISINSYKKYFSTSTINQLTQNTINKIKIALPSTDEQKQIGTYLDEKCATIDEIISEKESLITDLEAYKKSLIYEAVTGKRKVV